MIDLSKLTPMPWLPKSSHDIKAGPEDYDATIAKFWSSPFSLTPDVAQENRNFTLLARNAFDVMMRRGWTVMPCYINRPGTFWKVRMLERDHEIEQKEFPDPFTALVEADLWFKNQESLGK